MTAAEKKAYKAKQLRYKKPIVRGLNIETIQSELWDMISACEDIHWYDNNEESLVNALDGNGLLDAARNMKTSSKMTYNTASMYRFISMYYSRRLEQGTQEDI